VVVTILVVRDQDEGDGVPKGNLGVTASALRF